MLQIVALEAEKKTALANEDYETASNIKRQIEALKGGGGSPSANEKVGLCRQISL